MAIVSSMALVVALGLAAVVSFQPWAASQIAPRLSVAPGLGVALGDSVVVARGPVQALASARLAVGESRLIAAEPAGSGKSSVAELGVAPARALTSAVSRPPASPEAPGPGGRAPQPPQAAPEPTPVSVPVAEPVAGPEAAAPEPGGQPGGGSVTGPGSAGGEPGGVFSGTVVLRDDREYALSFPLLVLPTAFPAPGSDNLIFRIEDEAGLLSSFGLQLWDDGSGGRGLWASGGAAGGGRFLAEVKEGAWHEVVVYLRASDAGDGFYLVFLDGEPVDAGPEVSLIAPGERFAVARVGLFRDGEPVDVPADVIVGLPRVGEAMESVIP